MKEELLIEVLAAHADHLNTGGDHTQAYLAMFPEDRETLAPLLELATQVKMVLAPVEIPPRFRAQLRSALVQAADGLLSTPAWRSRLPERILDLPVFTRLPSPPKRQVLVRAAAGGAGLAAAGVAAYMLHERFIERGE
ncbi:MAG: hypothetical protein D6791_12165 [Chloroflexi bacterium]|nr:MAG: hypothetical protein D6791_12165 [Chloroflexota bacterium]